MAFSFVLSHVKVLPADVGGTGAWIGGLITSVLVQLKHFLEKPLQEAQRLLEVQGVPNSDNVICPAVLEPLQWH